MLKNISIIFLSASFIFTFTFLPFKNNIAKVQAAETIGELGVCPKGTLGKTDLFATLKEVSGGVSEVARGLNMIECLIWGAINFLLELAWIIAMIMIMVSGIKYMTSAGNPTAREGAIKSLSAAILGFTAILLVFALLNFFLEFIEYSAFVG